MKYSQIDLLSNKFLRLAQVSSPGVPGQIPADPLSSTKDMTTTTSTEEVDDELSNIADLMASDQDTINKFWDIYLKNGGQEPIGLSVGVDLYGGKVKFTTRGTDLGLTNSALNKALIQLFSKRIESAAAKTNVKTLKRNNWIQI